MSYYPAMIASAALLTVGTAYAVYEHAWLPAFALVHGAGLLVLWARGERAAHRRALALAQRAELAARPDPDPPLAPHLQSELKRAWAELNSACCLPAGLSHHTEHDPTFCSRNRHAM
ncbi:hypothetical protein GPA10_38110 [Streptomyces sp. p1417]|uniref:Uncharacterized protein n=1 Tax=Streptomyces typhae TaxID=2681492 RepID=A0A6L6X987_9ACTN|nr:hypothetical protein [Streptomyces typhae]MVO90412.1 hypothetical protein [Streptomyces typhae]